MPKYEKPYSQDMEAAVIGAVMLLGRPGIGKIRHIITAKDFYFDEHRYVYMAYEDLYKNQQDIDVATVADWLRSKGYLESVGGAGELMALTDHVPTASHVAQYAKSVQKYATLRKILAAAKDINEMAQRSDVDVNTLLQTVEEKIKTVTRDAADKESKLDIADLAEYMKIARENPAPAGTVRGLSTGIAKLDKMTQGFVPGELMVISGQTSHGKTQLSNNIMLNVVNTGKKAMFITMEMTKIEIGERFNMLTDDHDIPEGQILLNMHADLAYQDVTKLVERAKEKGCELVVIDHLHYFSRSVDNATAEIGKIVKEFKSAAITYEMPIILICHVVKMAPSKHPTIEHLRDSSMIAQDADMVVMVWRDESPGAKNPNEVELTLWKNRNRQKKHRRDFVFTDGMKLVEEDPRSESDIERQRISENTNRILGEKDDDLNDLELPW